MTELNIFLGDVKAYRRFAVKCAKEHLMFFDKIIFYIARSSDLLWKAIYDLRLKEIMEMKMVLVKYKGYALNTLLCVKINGKVMYYDNGQEIRKFKKWVKSRV